MKKNRGIKIFSVLIILALLVLSVPVTGFVSAQNESAEEYVLGELIVGVEFRDRIAMLAADDVNAISAQVGAEVVDAGLDESFFLLRFGSEVKAQQAMNFLLKQPGVEYVERNYLYTAPDVALEQQEAVPLYNPSDPARYKEWHLDKTLYYQAPAPKTTKVPCIVVIDSGVDYNHPELKYKVYKGKDFVDNDMLPMDLNGNGTHMAGTAAAKTNNKIGIAGISPTSNILAVRVLAANGTGTAANVAKGIQWANSATSSKCGNQNPKIYVLGFNSLARNSAITKQINVAASKGRLVVVAAGDKGRKSKVWPAAEPNAFAVSATEQNDRRAHFSNYDTPTVPWVDIAAPGYSIYSTLRNKSYGTRDGTSMAAAVVAGTAARVWSQYPYISLSTLRNRLQATADPANGGFLRTAIKRVNLYRALGGVKPVLQGQIFNPLPSAPLKGARVVVKDASTGTAICTTYTKDNGYFTCFVSKNTKYTVRVSKFGFVPQVKTLTTGTSSTYFFNFALAKKITNGWNVTTLWKGWQPYQSPGREFDLWLVEPTTPTCYSPSGNVPSPDPNIIYEKDSFRSGQSESIMVYSAKGGILDVWVSLWDGGSYWGDSRLTGSGLEVIVYKNNAQVVRIVAPYKPTGLTNDNWYLGTINLDTGVWTLVNRIQADAQLPTCVNVPPQ